MNLAFGKLIIDLFLFFGESLLGGRGVMDVRQETGEQDNERKKRKGLDECGCTKIFCLSMLFC